MMARTSIFLALLDGVVRLCFMPWYYTNIVKLDFYSATFAHEILKIPSSLLGYIIGNRSVFDYSPLITHELNGRDILSHVININTLICPNNCLVIANQITAFKWI